MTKNMIFTSAGDNTSFDELWLGGSYDIYVFYYGDNEDNYQRYKSKVTYIEKRKGSKFQNFSSFYRIKQHFVKKYDYIFVLDDDIIMNHKDIDKMFIVAQSYDLWICQPSFCSKSQISHEITKHKPTVFLQYTNFIEVNTCLFKKSALDKLMYVYDDQLIGWGIDYLSIQVNGIARDKYAVVHDVVCTNPTINDKTVKRRELSLVDKCDQREKIWCDFAKIHDYKPSYEHETYATIFTKDFDVFVINLFDRNDRFSYFKGMNVNRFKATDGRSMNIYDAVSMGVSKIIMKNTNCLKNEYYSKGCDNNEGKVGCWLSHKRLLMHLMTLPCNDDDVHLILEDDVCLDNLYKCPEILKLVPSDWDIVYAGLKMPNLSKPCGNGIYRGVSSYPNNNNYGTHAYFIKHRSIPKILEDLRFMIHEIDVQYDILFDKHSVYVLDPPLVTLNEHELNSSIDRNCSAKELWTNYLIKIISPPLNDLTFTRIEDLECFARIFAGSSPWLSKNTESKECTKIMGLFRQLCNASLSSLYNLKQSAVECANICYGLLISKHVLWNMLNTQEQESFIQILLKVRRLITPWHIECNWCLFFCIIDAFLFSVSSYKYFDSIFVYTTIKNVESWYVGDGFYKDGNRGFTMDYYNSYVIHPLYIEILKVCDPEKVSEAYKRCIRFTEFLERIVFADGSFPPLGRSITYRLGAFHALSYCILNESISELHSYQSLQRLLQKLMLRMITSSIFDEKGLLHLGFTGLQETLADSYSNWGSMYFITLFFIVLGLPDDHTFWIDSEELFTQELAWAHNKAFTKYIINK
jgi:hypothetical protein